MAKSDLIYHESLHGNPVIPLQIRIFVPVTHYIGIQIRIMLIIQIALIGKIHQYHFRQYDRLISDIQRHHIIFIQSGHSYLIGYSECIPLKILCSLLLTQNQKSADCRDRLR